MEETITKEVFNQDTKNKRENNWHLIIWNDVINDMMHVVEALYYICKVKEEIAFKIMIEAHATDQAIAKSGSLKDMEAMQQALGKKHITASVVKEVSNSN